MGHVITDAIHRLKAGPIPARIVLVTGMRFEARLVAALGIETLYGLRAQALEYALQQRLMRPCAALISFGVAGGLARTLAPGTILLASKVHDGKAMIATDSAWLHALRRALPEALCGALLGVDQPLSSVAEKSACFAASAALAVDMESHIVARLAQAKGLPLAVCRVVLDPAQRSVPTAALAAMGADGRIDLPALLHALFMRPNQLPALLRLGYDAYRAKQALQRVKNRLESECKCTLYLPPLH
jgi:hopanoid-associated phosphorylase